MRKIIALLIILISINSTYSQIPVGIKHDVNGISMNGYYDPLTYSPVKQLSETHLGDSFEKGHYYDKPGNKNSGLIKFKRDKIWFKKEVDSVPKKYKNKEIENFVIGIDSFFIIKKHMYKNSLKTEPVYVKYLVGFKDLIFAKHYEFHANKNIESYLVKSKEENSLWMKFPKNKSFKDVASKCFDHVPYLKNKISSGDYGSDHLMTIIKTAEYYEKYKNSETILYDQYWQEIRDPVRMKYIAKIKEKKDSTWTLEYYKDSLKLYTANYTSFYPNKKNGDFISYFSNGEMRQIITYHDNEPGEIKTFYKTGILKSHYLYVEKSSEYSRKKNMDIFYTTFNDSLGNNILKKNGISTLQEYDKLTKFKYTRVFDKNKLISVYRVSDTDTIFQITDPNYDFKIGKLQGKFDVFMYDKKYVEATGVNAQGTILISLLIDDKGFVVEGTLLNKVHPELDNLANSFIKGKLLEGSELRYKSKPFKKDKVKRHFKVIVPINFSINRFYRAPVNYYHFDHMWHMQQMMMHQQNMMNNSSRF